jgi:hypothetical protein
MTLITNTVSTQDIKPSEVELAVVQCNRPRGDLENCAILSDGSVIRVRYNHKHHRLSISQERK